MIESVAIILKIAGVGLFVAVVNGILEKSDKKELTTYTSIAGILIAVFMLVDMMGGLWDVLKNIFRL
ncbi:MAG: SpoIIIAC/SpoIIIAD family protein [Clostridia bacterium]|nr:SpoIIIAC/SpoIIIAD family protein [Clostridia bacterium]MDY5264757.1 SpoIIIAC/SpoIIIAD family protein [Eubacteriales bacterium]MDY5439769.1 SpoIIIAC/SpoIIIAD family protein [Eubacteriales bacterium]